MTGITYVVTHPGFRSVKVGYTGAKSDRREQLARRGWEPYRDLVVTTHQVARRIEQATIFDLRFRLYIPPHLIGSQMPDGGWSETASISLISARELWDLVCEQAALVQLEPTAQKVRPPRHIPVQHRRTKGDTPRYVRSARIEAARTARAAQVGAPNQSEPKNAAKSTRPNDN